MSTANCRLHVSTSSSHPATARGTRLEIVLYLDQRDAAPVKALP